MSEESLPFTSWAYVCSFLLGHEHKIVGVHVIEACFEAEQEQVNTRSLLGIWYSPERRASSELVSFAREFYSSSIGGCPIPIADRCAEDPSIRLERAIVAPDGEELSDSCGIWGREIGEDGEMELVVSIGDISGSCWVSRGFVESLLERWPSTDQADRIVRLERELEVARDARRAVEVQLADARENAANWKGAADADSRRLDALEAELAKLRKQLDALQPRAHVRDGGNA